ncbi:hypothetical protein BC30048_2933 [Bacillus cereus]|uniref:DUF1643 domain-containing protein n=1 Tax=Bacillus cereus TaxID=1396 RepID=UPI001BAAEFBF|nr:DUF1643 domain-containing protein [Bacillus cereus]MEB9966468.1 DUF1643 domain-containing protein [Bacillus cereus]BCD00031.1 hypothetical protein BC30048_2933 [Bacillus cereus]
MWFEQLANRNYLLFKEGTYAGIQGKAIFNTHETRRYFLEKRWAEGGDILTAFMMNPSHAAHNQTDNTVEQIIDIAKVQGCHALYVVNVSSMVNPNSNDLDNAQFEYEEINWTFVLRAITEANVVFLGWGVKGQQGILKHQNSNSDVVNTFKNSSEKLYCYDVLKSKDKKYVNYPLYYVPHPRPIPYVNKYCNETIRKITDQEFIQLFIR